MREFADRINWDYISQQQNYSEDFIREFKDKVEWMFVSEKPYLSYKFLLEFKKKLMLRGVFQHNQAILKSNKRKKKFKLRVYDRQIR